MPPLAQFSQTFIDCPFPAKNQAPYWTSIDRGTGEDTYAILHPPRLDHLLYGKAHRNDLDLLEIFRHMNHYLPMAFMDIETDLGD
jgi:hypothetical protein